MEPAKVNHGLLKALIAALTYTDGDRKVINPEYVKGLMDELTDGQREQIIAQYCECGSRNLRCQCWNDD